MTNVKAPEHNASGRNPDGTATEQPEDLQRDMRVTGMSNHYYYVFDKLMEY